MKTKITVGVSNKFTFDYWDIFSFLKGRKRMAITILAALLSYVITDQGLISILAGGVVEMLFAIGDYYFSKVHVKVN